MELRVAGKYHVSRRIGGGSFGDIYLGVSLSSSEEIAIKLENKRSTHPQLLYEYKFLKRLAGGQGVPNVMAAGTDGEHNYMCMELLGPSLEDLKVSMRGKMSLKTVLMLADQMLDRVEFVHSKSLIHRDIKPDNYTMGRGANASIVYIIDFGLAKRFYDLKTKRHIPYRDGRKMTGTVRYASISMHSGIEQSRRDDLESLNYVFLYLINGQLPWQGLPAKTTKEKYERIMNVKLNTPLCDLCSGLPYEFELAIAYCRSLSFEDCPDYDYLKRLYRGAFIKSGFCLDLVYDWSVVPTVLKLKEERKVDSARQSPKLISNKRVEALRFTSLSSRVVKRMLPK